MLLALTIVTVYLIIQNNSSRNIYYEFLSYEQSFILLPSHPQIL
jgi:hypothetical protein